MLFLLLYLLGASIMSCILTDWGRLEFSVSWVLVMSLLWPLWLFIIVLGWVRG